ncbi:MAG: argininosuccinate lyase [Anaerolineae bacterium]
MTKLWGGRFDKATDDLMERFNASISFDWRLYEADIQGSIAYAKALERAGLLSAEEQKQIVAGLRQLREEFERGEFEVQAGDEDIHTAVERRLQELVGSVAGKLHTGRSRNDQVVTDVRLYALEATERVQTLIAELQQAIVDKAEAHLDLIMPGYTHSRQAQPILFSHWLLSCFWMLQRDRERLADLKERLSVLPLGAGALAGNPFPIDRQFLAQELGFDHISENSLDAVSDRDFLAELLFCAALLQVHLSQLAEDLILFSAPEYGFFQIDQAYATGSSLMPHKINPDSLELIRGKTGRTVGDLTALLTTLKGLPSAYNKDLQEDKEPLFDAIDTLEMTLPIMAGVVRTLAVDGEKMLAALNEEMLATDLADYLVEKGIPFRESHSIVGQMVKQASQTKGSLRQFSLAQFRQFSSCFEEDVYTVLDFRHSVERRASPGGTGTKAVTEQIKQAKAALQEGQGLEG